MERWKLLGAFLFGVASLVTNEQHSSARVPLALDSAPSRAERIANAITELDVSGARRMLEEGGAETASLGFERARLAIYTADCDGALAILSAHSLSGAPEASALGELAKTCARATAGAVVIDDPKNGIWLRLQDEADRVLVPFITDVAVRARAAMLHDFGVELPKPLRIDLVRDLFSLSAVSGLPLSAAETTGTVAVARWGRVTMLSPRATPYGYQWEDTLAHEITHLALSRATRDRAPLWLQEGIAKREETRWRKERPFDDTPAADAVAHSALIRGQSIGIDKLGSSIAMLPTPEAASTAFSEVTSFMNFFLDTRGKAALRLLLADLKGLSSDDPSQALRSVTGYDLEAWMALWRAHLLEKRGSALGKDALAELHGGGAHDAARGPELARRMRTGDLLFAGGHVRAAAKQLEPAVEIAPREAAVRWHAARALLMAGEAERAKQALGTPEQLSGMHGPWFALHGRFMKEMGEFALAKEAFALGIAADPLLEDVACLGHRRIGGKNVAKKQNEPDDPDAPPLPEDPEHKALCIAARTAARD